MAHLSNTRLERQSSGSRWDEPPTGQLRHHILRDLNKSFYSPARGWLPKYARHRRGSEDLYNQIDACDIIAFTHVQRYQVDRSNRPRTRVPGMTTMDFREQQRRVRKRAYGLVACLTIVVAVMIAAIYLALVLIHVQSPEGGCAACRAGSDAGICLRRDWGRGPCFRQRNVLFQDDVAGRGANLLMVCSPIHSETRVRRF